MPAKIVKINGNRLHRRNIAYWEDVGQDETTIKIHMNDGSLHQKDYGTNAKAIEALEVLDNLTDIDDLDAL